MTMLNTRNVDVRHDRMADVYADVTGDFNVKFGAIQTAAVEQWYEAYDMLTGEYKTFHRHKVKHMATIVCNRLKQYEDLARIAYHDRYAVFKDYCNQCYADRLQSDCEKTYFAVLRLFYRIPFVIPHITPLQARLVTAKEIMRIALKVYETYWDAVEQRHGYDFRPAFRYADMSPVLSPMSDLCNLLTATGYSGEYNLAEDRDCNNGFMAIINRVLDIRWIDEMGIRAMRLNADGNPAMQQAIEEHDRRLAEYDAKQAGKKKMETPSPDLSSLATKYKVSRL